VPINRKQCPIQLWSIGLPIRPFNQAKLNITRIMDTTSNKTDRSKLWVISERIYPPVCSEN
jgi:hypothetical protein